MTKSRVKQVVNYVNYQVQKEISASPQDLPAATTSKVHSWLFNVDDPSSRSSGRRETWDEEDTKLLERKFRKEDSLPSTVVIRTMCQKDKDLVEILDRKGWNRLYTKIRNMFKKKKREKTLSCGDCHPFQCSMASCAKETVMYMFVLLNVLDSEGGSCPRSGESLDDPEELCEKIEKS